MYPTNPLDQITFHQAIEKIARAGNGKVGVSAVHLPTHYSYALHAMEAFPTASTIKLPLAILCLTKVDAGELSLDQVVTVHDYDVREGSGVLNTQFQPTITLAQLIHLMMEPSDNTATDLLLKLCGGPSHVTQWLRSIGIKEITMTDSCLTALLNYNGIKLLPLINEQCTLAEFKEMQAQVNPEDKLKAAQEFLDHCTTVATPRAMTTLLRELREGELLKPATREFLLQSMQRCVTGLNRIRKLLPEKTYVADKTGTIGTLTADVGLVGLPHQKGDLLLAIYVRGETLTLEEREEIIAIISRLLYESLCTL